MRRLSKASSAVSTSGTGLRRSLHGLTCLGVLGLAAFTGSSASAATDPCANAAYRVGPSATLADCRAYEQVSPVEKGGNQVKSALGTSLPNPGWSSSDGNTALYNPTVGPALPDPVRGFNFAQIGERTSEGWVTRVAANGPSANAVINGTTVPMINQLPSEDRKSLLFVSGAPFTLDNPNLGTVNSGGVNLARGGSVEWLSKPIWAAATPTPGHIPPAGLAIVGATPDLSTAFFTSWATLTPEDGASGRIGVEAYTDPDVNRGLYRWKGGQLSNAGQLPDGTLDPWGAVMAGWVSRYTGSNSIGNPTDLYGPSHSVSPDGSSWVFVSPDPAVAARSGRPSQLYLGREGLSSVLLSTKVGESEPVASSVGVSRAGARAGASSGDAASYAMRSKDGRFIVFTTADSLTEAAPEDASQKTYRYDMDQQTLTYLPDLTFTAAFSTLGPVLSMSDDGSRILYYNWDTGVLGLWRDNATAVVLAMTDLSYVKKIDSRFSKDGRTLVLTSEAPLRAQSDHPAGQVEIYRYTESDDALACISCPPESVTPRGLAVFSSNGFAATSNSAGSLYAVEPTRGMSDDGKRVFFHTTSPLVGADHNAAADVYEWREGSGLRMLSSGRAGATNAYIVDNDATGDNVFFVTGDGLVPQDTDGLYDLYDARVDGGFPEPQPSLSCSGEGCRGSASSPPSADAPQSSTLRSRTTASKRATARTETLSLKRATANVGGIRVKVVTAGPGRLKAQGRGLQTTSRTVKRAATYTLKLGLRQQARQTLKDKGWLKVRVRVRFQPDGGKAATQTVQLTIKTNRKGR